MRVHYRQESNEFEYRYLRVRIRSQRLSIIYSAFKVDEVDLVALCKVGLPQDLRAWYNEVNPEYTKRGLVGKNRELFIYTFNTPSDETARLLERIIKDPQALMAWHQQNALRLVWESASLQAQRDFSFNPDRQELPQLNGQQGQQKANVHNGQGLPTAQTMPK